MRNKIFALVLAPAVLVAIGFFTLSPSVEAGTPWVDAALNYVVNGTPWVD